MFARVAGAPPFNRKKFEARVIANILGASLMSKTKCLGTLIMGATAALSLYSKVSNSASLDESGTCNFYWGGHIFLLVFPICLSYL